MSRFNLALLALVCWAIALGCGSQQDDFSSLVGTWKPDYSGELQKMLDDSHGKTDLRLTLRPDGSFTIMSQAGDQKLTRQGAFVRRGETLILTPAETPDAILEVQVQEGGNKLYIPSIRTPFVRAPNAASDSLPARP